MKVAVAPFLTAADEAVVHSGWHLRTSEGETPLPDAVTTWDYQTVLPLEATVTIDAAAVHSSCGLEENSSLAILVTAHSSHTGVTKAVVVRRISTSGLSAEETIQLELAGDDLGGLLTLETALVATDPKPSDELAATLPGSRLWSVAQRTHLQGSSAQFPTDASDFARTRQRSLNAGWDLEVDRSDPDAAFLATVRLTINSGNPTMRGVLEDRRDDLTEQIKRMLRWDVTRQLVGHALVMDEVLASEVDGEATTLSGVLRNLLAAVWPHESPTTLRGWLDNDRARLERDLQHHCSVVSSP